MVALSGAVIVSDVVIFDSGDCLAVSSGLLSAVVSVPLSAVSLGPVI